MDARCNMSYVLKVSKDLRKVSSGGYSSKLSFIDPLIEEIRIRFDNKQNFIYLLIIFICICFFEIINKFKL